MNLNPFKKASQDRRKAHEDMRQKLDESEQKLDLILERLRKLTANIPAAPKKLKAVK